MNKVAQFIADAEKGKQALESYGYKLVTWSEFVNTTDLPEGLLERAGKVTANRLNDRQHVIYDPDDNYEGWMLIGERNKIIRETVINIIDMEPPEGPLSSKELQ